MPSPSPARWLAPLSLLATAGAVLAILASTGGDGEGVGSSPASSTQQPATSTTSTRRVTRTQEQPRDVPSTYRVRPGDSLSSIAERTGVSLERLRALNPDVDPNALRVGQELELGG